MEASCPKCGRARMEGRADCAGCGLRIDLWVGYHAEPAPNPALDEAFAALQGHWEERAAHDAFLALARAHDALDGAAARYRFHLRGAPDDAAARRGLEQAGLLAVHQQEASPHVPPSGLLTVRIALIAVLLLLAIALGIAIYRLYPLLAR